MWKSPQCHHFRLSRGRLSLLKLARRLKNLDERSEEHFDILWHVLKRLGRAVFGRYWSVVGMVVYLWGMDSFDSTPTGLERLLSTAELAAFLGVPLPRFMIGAPVGAARQRSRLESICGSKPLMCSPGLMIAKKPFLHVNRWCCDE